MKITLNSEQANIIEQQLAGGHLKPVDEVLTAALVNLPNVRGTVRRAIEFAEERFIQLPPGETIRELSTKAIATDGFCRTRRSAPGVRPSSEVFWIQTAPLSRGFGSMKSAMP